MARDEASAWGLRRILADDVDRLLVLEGGFCSLHVHRTRHNLFRVESGELLVGPFMSFSCPSRPEWRRIGPDCGFHVHPGIVHRFWSPQGCICVEVSWGGPRDDIERFSDGGISASDPGF